MPTVSLPFSCPLGHSIRCRTLLHSNMALPQWGNMMRCERQGLLRVCHLNPHSLGAVHIEERQRVISNRR